jgi:TIR domain
MSTVQIAHGDMFDGPSDLIVLPCSSAGTITDFVRRRLIHHNIPYPKPGLKLGEVSIMPFEGGENIAQYVAYAASVAPKAKSTGSSREAIRHIGERLGAASKSHSTIRLVSAPLLGTGAGNMKPEQVVPALSTGFKSTAHRDARLVIHVLDEETFEDLSPNKTSEITPSRTKTEKALRVFVSYSHSSHEHEQWVESLGTFLRNSGIEARIDIWHLRRGMDLAQFMTNELAMAERVILVSDEKHAEKADGRLGGVGWETMIVQGDMASLPAESTKYVVIVPSEKIDNGLPRYLKTKFVIHWPENNVDKKNREILLRELYDVVKIPPLGRKPVFL